MTVVRIFIKDQESTPIQNCYVGIYNTSGTLVTVAFSDAEGLTEFTLPSSTSGVTYEVRTYKNKVSFKNSKGISVITSAEIGDNDFEISGYTLEAPIATDSKMCRVYGNLSDLRGKPLSNSVIELYNLFSPLIVDDTVVLADKNTIKSDSAGYVEFDLYRTAKHSYRCLGLEGFGGILEVPDQPNVLIANLLFPRVAEVVFGEPLTLNVGESQIITPTVVLSSGVTRKMPSELVKLDYDNSYVSATWTHAGLKIEALKAGTTTIISERQNDSIIQIPKDAEVVGSLTVNIHE